MQYYPRPQQEICDSCGIGEASKAKDANDPDGVGLTILKLINIGAGKRPLWVPVGKDVTEVVTGLNKHSAEYQRGFLETFGFGAYAPYAA